MDGSICSLIELIALVPWLRVGVEASEKQLYQVSRLPGVTVDRRDVSTFVENGQDICPFFFLLTIFFHTSIYTNLTRRIIKKCQVSTTQQKKT